MKNLLSRLNQDIRLILKDIGNIADERGVAVFVVGGLVRDLILGKENFDLDIVVEGDAITMAEAIAKRKKLEWVCYREFGTATVIFSKGDRVDFATARKESYAHPGALPKVVAGSIHDDLFRRDFTINALAVRINPVRLGVLIDDFSGVQDLKAKRIRIMHDQSFIDDPTRILRAIRFEQRFNFRIEKHSLNMLNLALSKKAFQTVKPERIFEEFRKMLSEGTPQKSLKRCDSLGALDFLGIKLKNLSESLRLMEKFSYSSRPLQKKLFKDNPIEAWLVYFMILVEHFGEKDLDTIFKRFNLKKIDRNKIASSKQGHVVLKKLKAKRLSPSQIYRLLSPLSSEAISFLRIKAASHRILVRRIDQFFLNYRAVALSINGNDLINFGLSSGNRIGMILAQILDEKLDGLITTREEEILRAKTLAVQG